MLENIEITLITGEAGVGKSTYAHLLASDSNATVLEISKPIKALAYKLGWSGSKEGEGRSLLQNLGREGRELSYKIWTNNLILQIYEDIKLKQYKSSKPIKTFRYIVPDIRFDDEVMHIEHDFENVRVIKVYRDSFTSKLSEEQRNDITERGVSSKLIDEVVDLDTVFGK